MLISRGLHALLWSTLALAGTIRDIPPHHDRSDVRPRDYVVQQDTSRHLLRRNRRPHQARSRSGWIPGRLRSRQEEQCSGSTFCPGNGDSFQCCGEGSRCCTADDGSPSCCGDDCEGEECSDRVSTSAEEGEDGVSTVTITTTVLRTITAASGTTTTTVSSTFSQTLTFEDPALPTQTNTVTVTAAPSPQRRVRQLSVPETATESDTSTSDGPQATSGEVEVAAPGRVEAAAGENSASATQAVSANAGEDGVVTITTTVELPTTIVGITTITSTVINTEFVTITLAPSARVTKVVTTTVQPGSDSSSELPGGLTPPTDDDLGPQSPPIPPSGTASLLPPGAGPNPTQTGTRLPPGVTDILPSGTPTDPNDHPESMQPSPSSTNDPSRPIPGSDLTVDEIAGIALGIIFGLLFLILAGFLTHRLVRKWQAAELMRSHQEMSSSRSGSDSGSIPVAAGSLLSTSTRNRLRAPPAASDSSAATSPGEGDVRIVIRPAPKRRTQSSGLLPSGEASRTGSASSGGVERSGTRSQWPRPPGYSGQTYSFFIEESGSATPLDAGQWSVASEHGSRKGSASTGRGEGQGGNADRGSGGGGGSEFLSVGRALSPWKAV